MTRLSPARTGAALLVVCALLAAGAWWWGRNAPTTADDATPPPRSAAEDSAGQRPRSLLSAAPEPVPGPPASARLSGVYKLRYGMHASVGSDQKVEVAVEASLEAAAAQELAGQVWLPLRLLDAKIRQNDSALSHGVALQEQDLRQPWLARLEPDGRFSEVRFDATVSQSAQALLTSITQAAQLAQPPGAGQSWSLEERELNGIYLARYQRRPDGVVVKQRSSEPDKWPALTATSTFVFNKGALHEVTMEESGTFPVGSLVRDVKSLPYQIQIHLQQTAKSQGGWQASLDPAQLVAFAPALRDARDDRPSRPMAEVMQDLHGLKGEVATHDFVQLRDELARVLRSDPAAVAELEQQLTQRRLVGDAMLVGVSGLVSARSDEALETTARMVANARLSLALRQTLLQAATQLDLAPPALADATRDTMVASPLSGLGATAATALGALTAAMANNGHNAEAKQYLAKMLELGARIVAPATFGRDGEKEARLAIRVGWIGGFGNSGHPAVLPVLLAALQESDELVRAHAAYALRFQHPTAIKEVMVEVMAKEQSALVRDYLVSAMRYMGPDATLPLVEKALRTDASQMVRLTAAYVVGMWLSQTPGVRKVLQDALPDEQSPEVALAIQEFLKPGSALSQAASTPYEPDHHAVPTLEEQP